MPNRTTFVVQAENLARVVMLFHRLNVEIDVLYMVRRQGAETMRMSVTIQADLRALAAHRSPSLQGCKRHVRKVERDTKEVLGEPLDEKTKGRSLMLQMRCRRLTPRIP